MTRMLIELADVLRAAGLIVHEETGIDRATGNRLPWKQLGRRKSGVYNTGYEPGRPTALMVHHTATFKPIKDDLRYQNDTAQYRPITNLYWPRDGEVYVCAAGPSNTNGSGADTWGGGVPDNRMNEFAIGNEIANTGVGEPYPKKQQDAVMTGLVALANHFEIPAKFARGHFEWTSRKIDPYGPSRWNNNRNTFWNMDAFRNELWLRTQTDPDPTPGDDMKYLDDSHRMFDSRDFKDGPVPAGDYTFDLPSVIPNCSTIALTVTVVNPIGKGHVTLWAKGPIAAEPASKLNYHIENIANSTTVNIDSRRFRLYLSKAAHLILDVDGYQ